MSKLRFYDGRTHSINSERLVEFEIKAIIDRFYSNHKVDFISILEELGPSIIDYTNIQHWSNEIPDISEKSARLFTLWGEDESTKEIVVVLRGFLVLNPLQYGHDEVKDYFFFNENIPYYPEAVISSFRTIYSEEQQILQLLILIKKEIQTYWQKLRQNLIKTLRKTELWKRYVLSFEEIIHYSILCPSIDRVLIKALKKLNFEVTGVMQLLTSSTPSYDEALINSHIKEAKRIIEQQL